jgi:hypothetical protein
MDEQQIDHRRHQVTFIGMMVKDAMRIQLFDECSMLFLLGSIFAMKKYGPFLAQMFGRL